MFKSFDKAYQNNNMTFLFSTKFIVRGRSHILWSRFGIIPLYSKLVCVLPEAQKVVCSPHLIVECVFLWLGKLYVFYLCLHIAYYFIVQSPGASYSRDGPVVCFSSTQSHPRVHTGTCLVIPLFKMLISIPPLMRMRWVHFTLLFGLATN